MNYPINKCLETFTPYLDYNLVSPKAFSLINTLAKNLPAFSAALLECRLRENQPRVDFSIKLNPEFSIKFPKKLLAYSEWIFLQRIYDIWKQSDTLLYKNVGLIGLEFDIEEKPPLIPIPCLFFSVNLDKFDNRSLVKISSNLLDSKLSSAFKSNLKYCVDCLPLQAHIAHLGVMISRSEQTIRIVSKIPSDQILDYLIKIGWSGSKEAIRPLLLKLSEFTDHVCLSYDVGETIMPRIGLECYLLKQPKYESRWQLLLNYLVELNLCSSTKQNALLTWSGYFQKTLESQFLVNNQMPWNNVFLNFRDFGAFFKRISHLKIVCDSQNNLEAKAYLLIFNYCPN